MTTKTYQEVLTQIAEKKDEVNILMARYPRAEDMPAAEAKRMSALTDELTELTIRKKIADENTTARPIVLPGGRGGGGGGGGGANSIGEIIVNSPAFKTLDLTPGGAAQSVEIEYKTVLSSGAFALQAVRESAILPSVQRPLRVADLFGQSETSQSTVAYMEETTFTNNAAETAEGAAKPESALAFTEKTSPVRKIAVTLPVTDELLADVPGMAQYLNERVPLMVELREDSQLLNGDGIAPNLRGILNTVGIQTQAKGADPTPDAVYKAMVLIQTSQFMQPDAVIVHPSDWQDVRLLRTADGLYIFGSPDQPGSETLFGLKVVVSTAITQNTMLVGAFKQGARIARRETLNVAMSTEHSDYFAKNQVLIRAELREALVVTRPAAFVTVTGV